MAFLLQDWSLLYVAVAVCCCLSALLVLPLPESPRWLLLHGRWQQAEAALGLAGQPSMAVSSQWGSPPTWSWWQMEQAAVTQGADGAVADDVPLLLAAPSVMH